MWSLPKIVRMNAQKKASQSDYRRQARLRKPSRKHPCECCGQPSIWHLPYYDLFSDANPLSVLTPVPRHCRIAL
jgi:hypothetical protein